VELAPSLSQMLEPCLTSLHYLTGIQEQSLQRQWQLKPWRRWSHHLHLYSSCQLSTRTTSCVGSSHCMDWSLPDCRLLWRHQLLLDCKLMCQLTGFYCRYPCRPVHRRFIARVFMWSLDSSVYPYV